MPDMWKSNSPRPAVRCLALRKSSVPGANNASGRIFCGAQRAGHRKCRRNRGGQAGRTRPCTRTKRRCERSCRSADSSRVRETIKKQIRKRPQHYHGSGSRSCEKHLGFFRFNKREKNPATAETTANSTQEREDLSKKSGGAAA